MIDTYFYKIIAFFFVTITISKSEEQTCKLESCKQASTAHWKRNNNEIQSKISKALEEYNKQNKSSESIFSVINQDLKPFYNSHITKKMISSSSQMGAKYQLIDHKLYRDKECMFPSRCKGIEHFLLKHKNRTNYELVINTRDYPQVNKALHGPLPVFSFSKTDDFYDIMYPAWSFWCGGPAISLYPAGIGRWDKVRKSLIKTSQKWTWKNKKNLGFFRGSRTSSERDELIYLSRSSPDLVDAAYTKNQAWKSDQDSLHYPPVQEVSFEEHCAYKYLFNFRGVAASFRLKHLFLCRSLVFHVGNEWVEYFYPMLVPWVHYIPVDSNYTKETLKELIHFFKENDELAEEIANRGYEVIKSNLRLKNVSQYWKKLLDSYGKLLDYQPSLDKSLIEITE